MVHHRCWRPPCRYSHAPHVVVPSMCDLRATAASAAVMHETASQREL